MAFIPVANTLLVEVVFEQAGQVIENTSYWENAFDWTLADVNLWLSQVRTTVEEELLPLLHQSITLVRLVGTLLTAVDSLSSILSVSPPVAGSATGAALPNEMAYCVTIATAARGRSNRGRNYIAGIPVAATATANTVTTDFRTGVLSFYDTLLALGTDNDHAMVVVSRFSGVDSAGHAIPRAAGVTTPVTAFATFDDVLDSQRRRKPGSGV